MRRVGFQWTGFWLKLRCLQPLILNVEVATLQVMFGAGGDGNTVYTDWHRLVRIRWSMLLECL